MAGQECPERAQHQQHQRQGVMEEAQLNAGQRVLR